MLRRLVWVGAGILFTLAFIVTLAGWIPFGIEVQDLAEISEDLAFPISCAVLAHNNAQWGPNVVFSYGPLGYLSSFPLYSEQLPIFLAFRLTLAATTAVLLWITCTDYLKSLSARLLALSLFCCLWYLWSIGWSEGFWVASPIAICALAIRPRNQISRSMSALIIFAALVAGPAALVKFSFTVIYFGVFLLVGLKDLIDRKIPIALIAFVSSLLLSWVAAGQALGNFPLWVLYSLDFSAGYSDAMSAGFWKPYGSAIVASLYVASALLVAVPLLANLRPVEKMLLTAAAAGIALVTIQHSFGGNQIETSTISMITATLVFGLIGATRSRIAAGTSILLAGLILSSTSSVPHSISGGTHFLDWNIDHATKALTGRYADIDQNREHLFASLRKLVGLPPGAPGSVDTLTRKSPLAAAQLNLRYNPRPAFLSVNAHTERLAAANSTFLKSSAGPDYIIFDDALAALVYPRYPATYDGPAWLVLLSHYIKFGEQNGTVFYKKRGTPLNDVTENSVERIVAHGEKTTIDRPGLVWATIDIRRSAIGSAVATLYKAPWAYIDLNYTDGSARRYQMVPALGRAGFILSPTMDSAKAFAELSGPVVKSFSVGFEEGFEWFYHPEIRITISDLVLSEH